MRRSKTLLILGFFLAFFLFISPTKAWYYSGWQYRRKITITEQSGSTLTDYQVAINLTYDPDMQSDFSDIRFTYENSSGEYEIPYWIESKSDSNWAYVWVKVPEIPASSTATVYVYYGNSSATSESNGTTVFIQFHDFEDGTNENLNIVEGTFTATTDAAYIGNYGLDQTNAVGNQKGYWSETFSRSQFIVEAYMNHANSADGLVFIWLRDSSTGAGWIAGWGAYTYDKFQISAKDSNGNTVGTSYTKAHDFNDATWYKTVIYYKGSGTIRIEADGDYAETTRDESYNPDQIGVWCGYEKYWDAIFVREYADPEPTYSVGSEETTGTPPQYSNIVVSPSSPQTYGISNIWFNITWEDDEGVDKAWIVHNFTGSEETYVMQNDTPTHFYYLLDFTPSAGNYSYQFFANDTNGAQNSTDVFNYEIQKALTEFHLAINGTESDVTYTYPVTTNTTAWTNETGFDGVTLYRNGSSVSNPEVIELPAGVYNYTAVFEHQNYTAENSTITRILTINKADSGLTLTSSAGWTIFYGSSTTITCTANSPLSVTLKVNDVIVPNPYTFNPDVGSYDVVCTISDAQNYTPSVAQNTLNVNPISSCLDTYVYKKIFTSSADLTTLNFTELVNQGLVKQDLSDVYANVTPVWKNVTNGYYIIVNNSGQAFEVQFTNYAKHNEYETHALTATVLNVTNYEQQAQSITYNILDEQSGAYLMPPNATLIALIECSSGENYVTVNQTKFILASSTYINKAVLRVKYSADEYYSRQFYPEEIDNLNLNFYVTDAYQNALDRIDFRMLDTNYYNSLLQVYKLRENNPIIITEGYFDASHYFSAYLLEDSDYYLRTKNPDGSYTEFGRISVVKPMEKDLGKTFFNLNPQASLIAENIFMNAYTDENRTTIYVTYSDSLNQTNQVNITIYFENGTIFKKEVFNNVSSLDLSYNISDYSNESFTVRFSIDHQVFGNSPVVFDLSLLVPATVNLGISSFWYPLFALSGIILVGGIATRGSVLGGILLFFVTILIFIGIGWLSSLPWVFIAYAAVLSILAIINYYKQGGVG